MAMSKPARVGSPIIEPSFRSSSGSMVAASMVNMPLNLVQVQKWSFSLEKTTDFELDLVYNLDL
jgi:hypothetical protein